MRVALFVAFLFSFLTFTRPAEAATDEETVHFAAHVGLSYALQTTLYGVSTRVVGLDRPQGLLVSAGGTFAIGLVRQLVAAEGGPVNTRGLWQNALGIAASAGTIWVFEF